MVRFHSVFLNFPKVLQNEMHPLNLKTDSTSHLEQPNTENVSFNSRKAKLFFAILTFQCLKSVTTLLSFVPFSTIQHNWT